MFLEAHFGEVELHLPEESNGQDDEEDPDNVPALIIHVDDSDAFISLETMVCDYSFTPCFARHSTSSFVLRPWRVKTMCCEDASNQCWTWLLRPSAR